MPTKKKRARSLGNEANDNELDLPPTTTVTSQTKRQQKKQRFKDKHQDEGLLGHSKKDMADYPRAFRTMLHQEAMLKKKKSEPVSTSSNKVAATTKSVDDTKIAMKMRSNETFNDYSRRLKTETRQRLNELDSENVAKSDRKKRWRAKMKEKEQRKKEKLEEEKSQIDFNDLHDKVSFGEVVQQPPTITAKPKLRGKAAALQLMKSLSDKSKSVSDTTTTTTTSVALVTESKKTRGDALVDETRTRHRQRLKTMTPATRRILASERDRVVSTYRAIKEAKLQAKLNTP
ncbi:hypothetical protein BDF19DRAFT_432520 [Syncephalis fuscata]|nr:hypothetical protein BDF19DRAFT_432520 [Syncephalis fuscata]